ncbi:peroxiredoxin-like family protein [Mangrovivirga cuniculi]|uniref:Alkyl hydroperoxide reductase n=1 Tax=Mangrovivirga cuniculi TaxID=2715131 RepID=A0A4D7JZK6_9BACT|nr:peroxiredoxin-like family protein [Mangrovivirga cuniculi]QCK16145.1 alkyl hydroperoxide reductase [Mangrovivirga cuniculi]
MNKPTPKHKAPELKFPLINGSPWDLKAQQPENFTLVIFYRGLHCPICKKYLEELQKLKPEFNEQGVNIVAVSMDSEKRARLSKQKWEIDQLDIGYNLDKETAKAWSLYLSKGVKDGEPEIFSEPGLFLIDSKNEIYYSALNSNPWGRPYLPTFVKSVNYIINNDYPARGEMAY